MFLTGIRQFSFINGTTFATLGRSRARTARHGTSADETLARSVPAFDRNRQRRLGYCGACCVERKLSGKLSVLRYPRRRAGTTFLSSKDRFRRVEGCKDPRCTSSNAPVPPDPSPNSRESRDRIRLNRAYRSDTDSDRVSESRPSETKAGIPERTREESSPGARGFELLVSG